MIVMVYSILIIIYFINAPNFSQKQPTLSLIIILSEIHLRFLEAILGEGAVDIHYCIKLLTWATFKGWNDCYKPARITLPSHTRTFIEPYGTFYRAEPNRHIPLAK
jgi:hypothetical protein